MKPLNIREALPQIPNVLLRGRLRFHFDLLPFEAHSIRGRRAWNLFIAGLNRLVRPDRPIGYPVIAQVEPSNICNLRCPLCLSASANGSRETALLPFDTFKALIDDLGDYLLLIVLWNWGEPFLNPDLLRMVECATSRGILVHTSTNGNIPFSDAMADAIVASGLTSLVVAIDGATQATYAEYRRGGTLEQVKQNIRVVVAARKRRASPTPQIAVRFVAMRQNEAELPRVETMARELGADFFCIKSVDTPPALGGTMEEEYRPEAAAYRRYDYVGDSCSHKHRPFVCARPWKRITVDALGYIISCEYDYKNLYPFGRVGPHQSATAAWKSPAALAFRRVFADGHNDSLYHCRDCTYKNIKIDECNVETRRLHPPAR